MLAHMVFFSISGFFCYALLYTLINRESRKYYVVAKMLSSTVFMVELIWMCKTYNNQEALKLLLPPFCLCFIGDLLLGLHKKIIKKGLLIGGAGAFAIAHGGFVFYLMKEVPFHWWDLLIATFGIIFVLIMAKTKQYDFGSFTPIAAVYGFLLCGMAGKAISNFVIKMNLSNFFFMFGAVMFVTSDLLIMVLYFRKKRAWTVHGWNLATYYLAMYLIAISASF